MTEVVTGLQLVTVHIRDIQKARVFYRDILGLREVRFDDKSNLAVYAIPGTTTTLLAHVQGPGEGGRDPGTVSGMVFHHPDPTAACEEIKRRGGAVTEDPKLIERPNVKYVRAVIADPDGNEFLLWNRAD